MTVKKTTKTATPKRKRKTKVKVTPAKRVASKKIVESKPLLINPIDTPTNPLTYHRLMDWLARTGWVEGYIRKRISPMDAHLIEDYTQTIWEVILAVKSDTIMEVWYHGKGKFINFMKAVIDIQLRSVSCKTYNENKRFHHIHCTLSDEQWHAFAEGNTTSTWTDTYPVKYMPKSGNRKKMVYLEHEVLEITTDYIDLIDEQRHYAEEETRKEGDSGEEDEEENL